MTEQGMTDTEAAREVAWIARRTRELALSSTPSAPAEWLEFYERKAALWRHIGESGLSPSYDPAMLDEAEANARAWRTIVEDETRRAMRALVERESFTIRTEYAPADDVECDREHPCGPVGPCDAHVAAQDAE